MAAAAQTPASAAAKAGQRRRDQDQHRADEPVDAIQAWFAARGWQPFDFQRQVWSAMAQGRSGLLHATTGAGKTYAVWLGALAWARRGARNPGGAHNRSTARAAHCPLTAAAAQSMPAASPPPLAALWITPMRALAADTHRALALPLADLAPHWTLGLRSGDTAPAERARQDKRLPTALVTTPESLTLLLTRADARERLGAVCCVVVDEWHELVGNKRGVQVQLALARLALWNPKMVVWGLSATLGNLRPAMAMLLGPLRRRPAPRLVQGRIDKALVVDSLLPADPGRFSWGGHLGAQMRQPVVDAIESSGPTLVFTNVRSQAEAWYQMILQDRPDWAGQIALHHGSLDKSVREWVEAGLKAGRLRAVVATSSLDLGVDFLPVERVLQIGSAKGVARLLQRAGRSGHQPGRASRVTLVPTNTLELIEAVALQRAVVAGRVEPRQAPEQPLDVLVQHLVSMALGGGFHADELFDEVRRCWSYRALQRETFDWALDFVRGGGVALAAYPEYHRVVQGVDGLHRVPDRGIALRHRLQVGTIVSDSAMLVKWQHGGTLGQVEESFIARLQAGDHFVFGGRVLEFIRSHEMVAWVRKATSKRRGVVPAWSGGRMALSSELADATRQVLVQVGLRMRVPVRQRGMAINAATGAPASGLPAGLADGTDLEPELQAALPMLHAQMRLSHLPRHGHLLIERYESSEGHHLFVYPFAGRQVHIGLASLLAWRMSQRQPNTFSISVNDYGFELLAVQALDIAAIKNGSALAIGAAPEHALLLADMLHSLNHGALAQRRFREIARVAGLVFSGYPGAPKSTRQLQASSSLFYEVFRKYDPGNRLLAQAQSEVLAQELELRRLAACLTRLQGLRLDAVQLRAPSPFALALMVERFRELLSTEKLSDRLTRILADAQALIDEPDTHRSRAPNRLPKPAVNPP